MSTKERRCQGKNARGEPCGVPGKLVGPDGFCPAHRPGGKAEMQRRALRGAVAAKRAKGLDAGELPPLTDHAAAKTWLEIIGRAVSSGRLGDRQAQAAIKAVSEWVKAEESRLTREVVEQLRSRVEELEAQAKRQRMGVTR